MPSETSFRLNTEVAAAKMIDGEAIVINVITGHYYSLERVAADIWLRLTQGATVRETASDVSSRYVIAEADAAVDVQRLCDELLEHQLLVTAEGAAVETTPHSWSGERAPYTPPELQRFTDMADLLAFDPPLPGGAPDVWEAPV